MKGTITYIAAKTTKTGKDYWSVAIKGVDGFMSCWDAKIAEFKKGDTINYETTKKGDFVNMTLLQDAPIRDINSDMVEEAKTMFNGETVNHTDYRNTSIEAQVCAKGAVELVRALIEKGQLDMGGDTSSLLYGYAVEIASAIKSAKETLTKPDEPTPF